MIQSPFDIVKAGGARLAVAVCLLVTGISTHGLCVESDGASHVASRDHQCCDPGQADRGDPAVGFGAWGSPAFHECAHVPLVQPTLITDRPDQNSIAAVSLPCLAFVFDPLTFETDVPCTEQPGCFCSRTPLTVVLRL